jgi:hypothetical protein
MLAFHVFLEILELHQNQLTGEVPIDFFIPSLSSLTIQENNLNGTIPESVCNMTKDYSLKLLDVDCDKVSCSCCCSPVCEFISCFSFYYFQKLNVIINKQAKT